MNAPLNLSLPQNALEPAAFAFLRQLRPNGPWVLTAILPDPVPGKQPAITITATDFDQVVSFIEKHDGTRNLYYSVNPTRTMMNRKAAKTDIAAIEFALADCDPRDDETPDVAKARYRAAVKATGVPEPTAIVDSGNGLQLLWRLDKPIPLPDPVWVQKETKGKVAQIKCKRAAELTDEARAIVDDVEARTEAVMLKIGTVAGTQNVDRILRLPGTTNLPNAKKRKDGRVACRTSLLEFNDNTYPLDAFPLPKLDATETKNSSRNAEGGEKTSGRKGRSNRLVGVDELAISDRFKHIINTGEDPKSEYASRSECVFACCLALTAAGYQDDVIEGFFFSEKYPISAHVLEQPKPEEYLSRQIERAREKTTDLDIARMNESYALVLVRNKIAILKSDEPTLTLMNLETFMEWNAEHFVWRAGKRVELTKYWRTHCQKRKYKGIIFAPGRDVPSYWNLFNGFAVNPSPRGDFPLFRDHLLNNVALGNPEHYRWMFGFFAQIFQQPSVKMGTALVLRGAEGTGKTKVGEIFGHLLGPHYKLVDNPRLVTGQFNAHLSSLLLLHADEAFWAGDHVAEGKVKSLITSTKQQIEFKGLELFEVESYVRLLITGNANWLVPAGPEGRRWAVFDVGEGRIQDKAYFGAIDNEMNNGGYEALMRELMSFELSTVDLRTIPKTTALFEQKTASLTPEMGWWLDTLSTGKLPWGTREHHGPNTCPVHRLYERYIRHARVQGKPRRAIQTALGMFLNKHVPRLKKLDKSYLVWNENRKTMQLERGYIYLFPPLPMCRAAFVRILQQPVPGWDGGDDEDWTVEGPPDESDEEGEI